VSLLAPHRRDAVPGVLAAALLVCVYGGIALSVDFSRAAFGFQTWPASGESSRRDRQACS
jgi:hypothetical protein